MRKVHFFKKIFYDETHLHFFGKLKYFFKAAFMKGINFLSAHGYFY